MSETNLTRLDRRVVVLLDHPDDTASRQQGVSATVERVHRIHGTSLIWEASQLLQVGASTFATACTIFHRFYHQRSLMEFDVWSVAMASMLLTSKIEEEPHSLKTLINVFCLLYRKRTILVKAENETEVEIVTSHPLNKCFDNAKSLPLEAKRTLLKSIALPNALGPVYKEWHQQISQMERVILTQLGFMLYWIPDSHPHKFILYFCRVLETADPKFAQRAWNYCNDSCRLDLCTRFESEVIVSYSHSVPASARLNDSCKGFLFHLGLLSYLPCSISRSCQFDILPGATKYFPPWTRRHG